MDHLQNLPGYRLGLSELTRINKDNPWADRLFLITVIIVFIIYFILMIICILLILYFRFVYDVFLKKKKKACLSLFYHCPCCISIICPIPKDVCILHTSSSEFHSLVSCKIKIPLVRALSPPTVTH